MERIEFVLNEGTDNMCNKFLAAGATTGVDTDDSTKQYLYFTEDIKNAVVQSYIQDNMTEEMAKYTVDYFCWIYEVEN